MKLIFIRHGQTAWNAEHRVQGRTNIPLNERGLLQARCAGEAVRFFEPTAIYSSPLERAYQTAEAIARCAGVERITAMEELTEIQFGAWEGKNIAELSEQFPEYWRDWTWLSEPALCKKLGAESGEEVLHRAKRAIEKMISAHSDEDVIAIVSHTMPIKQFTAFAIGLHHTDIRSLKLSNCSISVINHDGTDGGSLEALAKGKYTLEMWNETAHLRAGGLL